MLAGAGRRMARSPSETPGGSRGSRDGAGEVRSGLVRGARRQQCTCPVGAVPWVGCEGDGSGALGVEGRAAAAAAVGRDAEAFTACGCDGGSGGD